MNATAKIMPKPKRTGSKTQKGIAGKSWRAQAYFDREAKRKATNDAMKRLAQEQNDKKITEMMKDIASKMAELPDPTPVACDQTVEFEQTRCLTSEDPNPPLSQWAANYQENRDQ